MKRLHFNDADYSALASDPGTLDPAINWDGMIARSILIEGKVQGVYFREWAVKTAQELDVKGWVRNCPDGCIEVYAVGEPSLIDRFIGRLHEGSPASEVEKVLSKEAEVEKLRGFMRRRSV